MATSPRRALIVIDVQNDYVGGALPIEYPPVEHSLANIGAAMDAAKAHGIPVVVVQNLLPESAPVMARGSAGSQLHQTVTCRTWDLHIEKSLPSAFTGTELEAWLQRKEIDTITIVGYMTHNCDFSTVVHAMHAGLQVEVLADACGAVPYANSVGKATAEEIHRTFTVVLQSRFAAVLDTAKWIALLASGAMPERDSIYGSNQRARHAANLLEKT